MWIQNTGEPLNQIGLTCNALALLKDMSVGKVVFEVDDAARIAARATVETIAGHSRSFRRLLRLVEHPTYLTQSRKPAGSST